MNGSVVVGGAKNACMAMMAAALLTDEVCVLRNVPLLRDVAYFIELLKALGVTVEPMDPHTWRLQAKHITHQAQYDWVRKMNCCYLINII